MRRQGPCAYLNDLLEPSFLSVHGRTLLRDPLPKHLKMKALAMEHDQTTTFGEGWLEPSVARLDFVSSLFVENSRLF